MALIEISRGRDSRRGSAGERWELPDGMLRCAYCGRFVAADDAFYGVEPGGVRGVAFAAGYCDELCQGRAKCAHGVALSAECARGCER